jgi:hypothetical protein
LLVNFVFLYGQFKSSISPCLTHHKAADLRYAVGIFGKVGIMKRIQFLAATVVAVLGATGAAQAIVATPDYTVSYSFSYSSRGGSGPTLTNSLAGSTGIGTGAGSIAVPVANESLGPSQFMTISPSGSGSGVASEIVTVTFTITDPGNSAHPGTQTLTESVSGLYQAQYNPSGALACSITTGYAQKDCIDWGYTKASPPTKVITTPYELAFNFTDGDSLAIFLGDYSDWNLKPTITFDDPVPAATPLPAALPLFAAGIGLFGLAGSWRKRRQQKRSLSV